MKFLEERDIRKLKRQFTAFVIFATIFQFTNLGSSLLRRTGFEELAQKTEVQKAYAAFPTVAGVATSSRATNSTSDSVTLPSSIASGDLILVFIYKEGNGTFTFPSPWVEIKDAGSGTAATIGIAYLIASGGETSVTVTSTASERFAAIATRISAASWHGTTPPEVSTGATGSNNAPDPDSVTASWGSADNLFIATFSIDTPDTLLPVAGWPTSYTGNQKNSDGILSAAGGAIATRELAASNDDPSAFDANGTASDDWWAGTVVVRPAGGAAGPSVTSFANNTDGTITDGGRSGHEITLTGTSFGTVSAGSRATCGGGAGTGCIHFGVNGSTTVADASVSAWSDTSITFVVSSTLETLGGVSALAVYAAGVPDGTPDTFYIYPNITGMAVCTSCNANAGREYNASDVDGIIMLQGDHFSTSTASTGTVTIFGSTATVHGTVEGSCTVAGYTSSTICIQVPTAISNSEYTGVVTSTRASDGKTDAISFRVLPRITSNTPASTSTGNVVQISGDHFCQSGTCPSTGGAGIAFRSSSTVENAVATTTMTIAKPSGTAEGDLLFAEITIGSATADVTPPTGWTFIHRAEQGFEANLSLDTYYKIASSSEPSSYEFILSVAKRNVGSISAYTGVSASSPLDVHATSTGASSSAILAPSITTTVDNALVIGIFSNGAENTTFGPPTEQTERVDHTAGSTSPASAEVADEIFASAGPTGTRTATTTVVDSWIAALVAFKPASGGGFATSTDNVKFGSTTSTDGDFVSQTGGGGTCDGSGDPWTHTEICVKVPTSTPAGSASTTVRSNVSYVSNAKAFNVSSTGSTIPDGPASLAQWTQDGGTSLSVGSSTASTTVVFKANLSASTSINMALQIEATSTANSFACGAGACGNAYQSATYSSVSSVTGASTTISGLSAAGETGTSYHWQARARNTTTDEYSAWGSFGGNGEGAADFILDITAPTITSLASSSITSSSAAITWNTSGEAATSRVQYSSSTGGNGYSYYRAITIDSTKASGTLTNFPVLVSSTIVDLKTITNGGAVTDNEGDDIIFTSDAAGSSILNFEREQYVSSTGEIYYWVQVPSISTSTDTTIYLFYGKSSVGTYQSSATGTWDSNYQAVWHLDESTTSTSAYIIDSTANSYHASSSEGSFPAPTSTGKIARSQNFDGVDDVAGTASDFIGTGNVSVCAWIYPISFGEGDLGRVIDNGKFQYHVKDGLSQTMRVTSDAGTVASAGTNAIVLNQWSHVCGTRNLTGAANHYINGQFSGTADQNSGTPVGGTSNVLVGNRADLLRTFDGLIDEIHISNIIRTPGWMLTEYNNQSSPSTFYTVGASSTPSGGGSFAASCDTNNDCTALADLAPPGTNSHNVALTSLASNTTYYFRARSQDASGNESMSTTSTFYTTSTSGLPATGNITSAVFDTGSSSTGAAYNSILWKGTAGTGKVRFQLATSNSSSGLWTYYGSTDGGVTCDSNNWYTTTGAGAPAEISCAPKQHHNHRFFRYKIQLCSNTDCSTVGATSPVVSSIVVNWSP